MAQKMLQRAYLSHFCAQQTSHLVAVVFKLFVEQLDLS